MVITEIKNEISFRKEPDPIVVKEAKAWYKRFTGRTYTSSDIRELVEIYTALDEELH